MSFFGTRETSARRDCVFAQILTAMCRLTSHLSMHKSAGQLVVGDEFSYSLKTSQSNQTGIAAGLDALLTWFQLQHCSMLLETVH